MIKQRVISSSARLQQQGTKPVGAAAPRLSKCHRCVVAAAAAASSAAADSTPPSSCDNTSSSSSSNRRAALLRIAAAPIAAALASPVGRARAAEDSLIAAPAFDAPAAAPAPVAAPAAAAVPAVQPAGAAAAPTGPAAGPPGAVPQDESTTLVTNAQAAEILTPSDKQTLALNRRVQAQNRAPEEFPGFVRRGFDILIIADGYSETPSGLLYKDFKPGSGDPPVDGQQVVFDYTGYNESASAIDSSYRQGRPSETRLGIAGLIPGFEEGIRTMRPGGKRRIIVPPRLGPPVGPSTFFSAKQCEVFDIELRAVRTCRQEAVMMFSRVVCE